MDRFSQRAKSKPKVYILFTVFEQLSYIDKFICCFFSKKKKRSQRSTWLFVWVFFGVFFWGGCREFFKTKYYPPRNLNLYSISIILWHFYDSFDHTLYSVKPKHRISGQHPSLNDDLPLRLASGSVKMKPNIKRFTESHVEFEDGSIVTNVDVVVLATGWLLVRTFKII